MICGDAKSFAFDFDAKALMTALTDPPESMPIKERPEVFEVSLLNEEGLNDIVTGFILRPLVCSDQANPKLILSVN